MLVDHLLKLKKEFKILKEQEIQDVFTDKKLDKTCFQHDMAYGDFINLVRRRASDKVLRDKAFSIAKNPRYDGYQRGLASMIYKFFDKKIAKGSGFKSAIKQNEQLAQEFHKPIV